MTSKKMILKEFVVASQDFVTGIRFYFLNKMTTGLTGGNFSGNACKEDAGFAKKKSLE
jgi:hypothetical protein